MSPAPILDSTLTCPHCGRQARERMPENACIVRWDCPGCGAELRPKAGDCCVFCSYGSVSCPSRQSDSYRRGGASMP